jgi:lysophospholipase L1-like esterase
LAVVRRYYMVIAACAAAVGCLALLPVIPAQGAARPPWAAPVPVSRYALSRHPSSRHPSRPAERPSLLTGSIAGCEQKLTRARRRDGQQVPALAIVGASVTAGVGPGNPSKSWAFLLARRLGWDAVIYGDPGAGYVRPGVGRKGPVADEIARADLRALAPALVIVQAGHDDIGVPVRLEQRRVTQAIALIRAEAPRARIALLTVFPGRSHRAEADQTDRAIVTAAEAADRQVIIMDPLVAGWTFAHVRGGLHPTAAGSAWIAAKVAGILREHGVLPVPAKTRPAGLTICDFGIRAPASPR